MIWFIPAFFCAAVVYFVDFIVRRKRWKNNTKQEKISLVLTLVFSMPYVFMSFLGIFLGINGTSDPNPVVEIINTIIVYAGMATGVVCLAATIASIVLRKKGKALSSIRVQVAAFIYCILILAGTVAVG